MTTGIAACLEWIGVARPENRACETAPGCGLRQLYGRSELGDQGDKRHLGSFLTYRLGAPLVAS